MREPRRSWTLHRVHRRARETRGQTAAEYMGVLLLVAAIITVVVTSGIGSEIKDTIKEQITDMKGAKPDCTVEGAKGC